MTRGEPDDDDPLDYMTTDSPSSYLFESRQPMMARYARHSRNQTGWRRVTVMIIRLGFAALLAFFVVGIIVGAIGLLREF